MILLSPPPSRYHGCRLKLYCFSCKLCVPTGVEYRARLCASVKTIHCFCFFLFSCVYVKDVVSVHHTFTFSRRIA